MARKRRRKELQFYPEIFVDLISKCALEKYQVRITVRDEKHGHSVKTQWYRFVELIREMADAPDASQQIRDLSTQTYRVSAGLPFEDERGWCMLFKNRSETALEKAAASAEFIKPGPTTLPTQGQLAPELQELLRVQAEVDKANAVKDKGDKSDN